MKRRNSAMNWGLEQPALGWLEPGKKEFTKENGGHKRTNMGKFSFPFTAH
jgi:hypothetical protein